MDRGLAIVGTMFALYALFWLVVRALAAVVRHATRALSSGDAGSSGLPSGGADPGEVSRSAGFTRKRSRSKTGGWRSRKGRMPCIEPWWR